MPAFTNAQNLTINNSQFTETTTAITNINTNGPTGIDILLDASCPDAAPDSSARSYPPRCFPGTREQYIQDIVNWVSPTFGDTPPPIYWMKGPAGVGKSAVAQTCSEKLKDMKKLGAAFFFSISGRNDPQKFFPSVAYQLSIIHPPYRDHIDGKILHDKTLVNKTMSFQFQYLIAEPLRELASQGKGIRQGTVIIVDGLDECEGASAQAEIIRIVAAAASDGTLPLCWAFFSRPEPQIEATFADPSIATHCHKVFLPISHDADGEIEMYLRNAFENILKRCSASVVSQWPSPGDMATLVGAARGLFVYAATVIRFIDHLSLPGPQKRLQIVIDAILERRKHYGDAGFGADAPFAELDAFYKLLLKRIPTEIFPSLHLLLASICRDRGLGVIFRANLLGLSKEDFEIVCNHASAVVHIRNPGKDLDLDPTIDTNCKYTQVEEGVEQTIRPQIYYYLAGQVNFYHKSFYDFLLDRARSGSYCVEGSEALAKHYLKMQLDYDRSYCWKGSELVLAPGVTDSGSSLSYAYTNELVNSFIRDYVYMRFGTPEDRESFPEPFPESCSFLCSVRASGAYRDARKNLHILTQYIGCFNSLPYSGHLGGLELRLRWYLGTRITCAALAKFNVNEFKLAVKQRERANNIQRHHPKWPSRIKYLLRWGHSESAVYRMGQGEKSIFWYWEIDYELGYYRDFWTTDLAEGEKIFRAEDFNAWPEEGMSRSRIPVRSRKRRGSDDEPT